MCYNGSLQNVFTTACWFECRSKWTQSLEAIYVCDFDGQNFSCFSSFPSSSALLLPLPFLLPLFLSPHPILLLLHFLLHCFYLPLPRPQFRAHALEHLAWYLSFCSSCHWTRDTPLRTTALDTPTFGCAHAYWAETHHDG